MEKIKMFMYVCSTCGFIEILPEGDPIPVCYCGLPNFVTKMDLVKEDKGKE